MSTLAVDRAARKGIAPDRVLALIRMLVATWAMATLFPLGIMGSSFAINLLIFAAIRGQVDEPVTGGLASLYVTQLIFCAIGIHQNFSFAVGLNASRRSYYSAAVLVALAQSLAFGVFLYGCGLVERATGGWGLSVRFFDPLPLTHSGSPVSILVYAVPLALMSAAGLFIGAVAKRWGEIGMFLLSILSIVVVGGLVALITYLDGWSSVWSRLDGRSWVSIAVGWSLIPTAAAVAAGWLVVRRATP